MVKVPKQTRIEHVAAVIKAAGGRQKVADAFGIRYMSVKEWEERGQVPPGRVQRLSEMSGMSREQIRPDIFAS